MVAKRTWQRPIHNMPPPGTKLYGTVRGSVFHAEVIEHRSAKSGAAIRFEGKTYPSMSAAARAAVGYRLSGWRFWSTHAVAKQSRRRLMHNMPPPGTKLYGAVRGSFFHAEVIEDRSAKSGAAIRFEGKTYPSMSAAARAAVGHSVNGWSFWRLD